MRRRDFLNRTCAGLGAMALAGCAGLTGRAAVSGAHKPNIVLVFADDLGWKDTSYNGSDFYKTPTLDRLATEGVTFTAAYAGGGNCAPSRACLMSGQYTPRHGVYAVSSTSRGPVNLMRMIPIPNKGSLAPENTTIAEALKAAGYATGHFGKWHLGSPKEPGTMPTDRGFDVSLEKNSDGGVQEDPKAIYSLTRAAGEFMEKNKERPFFAYVAHHAIHAALAARADTLKKFENATPGQQHNNPLYAACTYDLDDGVSILLKKNAKAADSPLFFYCGVNTPHPAFETSRRWLEKIDPAKVTIPPYEEKLHPVIEFMSQAKETNGRFTEEELRAIRRVYYAVIADLDDMVGQMLTAAAEAGLTEENTYFIFTSDHGEMNMEHRLDLKNALYEGSARVPLIIAGPGIRPGTEVDALVSLVDIYPTVMDMAGCKRPAWLEGHSLVPEMRGEKSAHPDWVLSQYHSSMCNTGEFMVRRGDWKYIAYAGYEPQLFNLKDDPDEMRNLAVARPDVSKEMDALLRSLVDYEAVDAKVKALDKKSFIDFRATYGSAATRQELVRRYRGWGPEQDRQIHRWLGEPEDMPPIAATSNAPPPPKVKHKKAEEKTRKTSSPGREERPIRYST